MMDLPGLPVTLVIKAPNQKIADQNVECMTDWTVQKLKQHLADVYPSKPETHQQKIIYSGKLLSDSLRLQDVLRHHGDCPSSIHTVHLVCSPAVDNQHPSSSTKTSGQTNGPAGVIEGLRHRGSSLTNSQASSTQQGTSTTSHIPHAQSLPEQTCPQLWPGHQAHMWSPYMASGQSPSPGPVSGQQQYMMLQQHMYAQYMSNYMQYYQGMMQASGMPMVWPTMDITQTHANIAAAEAAQPAQEQRGQQDQANGNMVMNAGGGQLEEDEDFERDWLDWMYTASRFLILLTIVYFYSTFRRFIIVLLAFVALYMYQAGWFGFARQNNRQQNANNQNVADNQEPAAAQANPPDGAADGDNNNAPADNNADSTPQTEQLPQTPRPPGILSLAWCFFKTFFTSLVPQPPPELIHN